MLILSAHHRAIFTSCQSAQRVYGDWEYTQHLWNRYQVVYKLFGKIKIWTTTNEKCEVPVWAWTQRAACGFSDFIDDFCKDKPEQVKKYHNKRVDPIWSF